MKKTSPSDIAKMDSLKIPKGGSSKPPSGSVPITVRFNAGEESLDDIFQSFHNSASGGGGGGGAGDSLSSSPQQQNPDEVNSRNNFLQGNFFNRKRSGSIEGPNSAAATAMTTLSSSESNSVGTWKLIKGKVSQAMEDIKSSKTTNPLLAKADDPDSDQDNATINSSISDELSLEAFKCDSDSDIEPDILLEGDVERSRIQRSLAHLKSKVKSRTQPAPIPVTKASLTVNSSNSGSASSVGSVKKDPSPNRGGTPATTASQSLRSTFLRKRKKPVVEGAEAAVAATANPSATTPVVEKKGIIAGKKEVEIESGVEMLEDMVPPVVPTSSSTQLTKNPESDKSHEKRSMELPIESFTKSGEGGDISSTTKIQGTDELKPVEGNNNSSSGSDVPKPEPHLNTIYVCLKSIPFLSFLMLLIVLCIPSMPDFARGVFSCLLVMLIFSSIFDYAQQVVVARVSAHGPEKSTFKIPDFKNMPICEIPAVEEHKTVKTYTGWMNEIHSYDPGNFHVSMTKSVYVKLDGSMLRISNTTAHVSKRQMWNEPAIDRKTITFTRHRTFNLLGCRIEMLPRGLARKRYFSRKYPMQLIIKNTDGQSSEDTFTFVNNKEEKPLKRPSSSKSLDEKLLETKSNKSSDGKDSSLAPASIPHQNSIESIDDRSERNGQTEPENDLDFAATVLNADLQGLQENVPDLELTEVTVPCGDETRILLFARGDREKEDWYRRFVAASVGDINDQDLHLPNVVMVSEADIKAAAKAAAILPETQKNKEDTSVADDSNTNNDNLTKSEKLLDKSDKPKKRNSAPTDKAESTDAESTDWEKIPNDSQGSCGDETYEGLLISTCAARNPIEYIRFMSRYQKACNQTRIPVFKAPNLKKQKTPTKNRREKRQEDELWKGIDQSLFLGPCGSVVWANVLVGRVLFSCLNDPILLSKIQDFLQKKLSSIKLPGFMEDVSITQIFLGDTPPLIHRVSQPVIDERGTWIDADLTYEGLMHMTITTKLNLLRLKRQHTKVVVSTTTDPIGSSPLNGIPPMGSSPPPTLAEAELAASNTDQLIDEVLTNCAIYDSDAESSGASSSETGSPTIGSLENASSDTQFFNSSPGNAKRLFKIVDRIAASNLFQYATELSYVQKAMENMSTNITLRVDLKGLVGRVTINIPPPPSDRIWLAFRGPPRLWISATPTVGDHTFDWSVITKVIESKLCEEVNKYLVYPNMIDVIVPFLGQSTYKE
ncbi:uncharacterized protein LOC129908277 isoform X3 [Episyrphus balteatus]|nr:uncharacterized protein LOC129908277 isoform X3 [Episyrphus balteatus]XP_055840644.1 uncharacterized protein LOC129908277 isoform X3 [Episyrphus balteatus]XP_055840645.1 uncharacterized protein LOC129908277 isoform X3 [Episyrphus balteatus]XP_055840646.1 uncharacterized protein LOC129908277 isoform X3 [Episyrphus balteatus]